MVVGEIGVNEVAALALQIQSCVDYCRVFLGGEQSAFPLPLARCQTAPRRKKVETSIAEDC